MARRKRHGRSFANKSRQAQLKVRLPEALRYTLEREARSRGHSMNTEIVRRLGESIRAKDEPTKVVAQALVDCLPDEVVGEIEEILMRYREADYLADMGADMEDERRLEEESK